MGCTQSWPTKMRNPDAVNVVTLSDAAVQRLPVATNENPLGQEKRKDNIDTFWLEQLECMDRAYSEAHGCTEEEFQRLETLIKGMSKARGNFLCEKNIQDVEMCFINNTHEPLLCSEMTGKLELCVNTLLAEASRKQFLEGERKTKAKKSPSPSC